MSILKDLESTAKDIDREVESIAAEIDKDVDKAVAAVKSGLAKVKTLVAKGFEDAEKELIDKAVKDAVAKYKPEIDKLRALAEQGIKSANPQSIVNDLVSAFTHADPNAAAAVLSNLATSTMRDAYKDLTELDTLTLSADAEVDLVFGIATTFGGGVRMQKLDIDDSRLMMDFFASGGAEEGADIGLALGIWEGSPKEQQGGYLACTVGADLGAGSNLIVFLSMTFPPAFSGIVLDITGGEEVEASIDFGYTLTFKPPKGTTLNVAAT